MQDPHHLIGRIGEFIGAKFWFHDPPNRFITVAKREVMLPFPSLTARLVIHARPNDVTEGYANDRTVSQLPEPVQKVADRIEVQMSSLAASVKTAA